MRKKIAPVMWSTVAYGVLVLTGCQQENPAQTSVVSSPPEVASSAAPQSEAGRVVLEVFASDERVRTNEVGNKVNGTVHATGASGALVFGPYVSLSTGSYTLLVEGSSTGPFTVDVVYGAGSGQLAAKQFLSAAGNEVGKGSLASLDFDVSEAVTSAEFRVIVPDNTDTSIASYMVVTR